MRNTIRDQRADDFICVAEGQALAHKVVGAVGRIDKPAGRRRAHAVGMYGDRLKHGRKHVQAEFDGVHRVEHGLFVFLHILVVGQRQ